MTITALSDAELLDQARNGDEAAFTELYVRHQAAALRLARSYRRLGDPDDLVNGAFERVLGALRRGAGPTESFRAYLFVTLRRLAAEQGERPADEPLDSVPEPIRDVAQAPELAQADREMITKAFESLPDRWQAVLWHTAVEGRKPSQLADVLGVSANAAAAMAYRAREKLRQAYLQAHLLASPAPDHEPFRSQLGAYVRHGLSKRDEAAVMRHLEQCESCRALLAELDDVNRMLAQSVLPLFLLAGGTHVAAIVGLGGATAAGAAGAGAAGAGKAAGAANEAKPQKKQLGPTVAAVAAVAALVAGIVGIGALVGREDEGSTDSSAAADIGPTGPDGSATTAENNRAAAAGGADGSDEAAAPDDDPPAGDDPAPPSDDGPGAPGGGSGNPTAQAGPDAGPAPGPGPGPGPTPPPVGPGPTPPTPTPPPPPLTVGAGGWVPNPDGTTGTLSLSLSASASAAARIAPTAASMTPPAGALAITPTAAATTVTLTLDATLTGDATFAAGQPAGCRPAGTALECDIAQPAAGQPWPAFDLAIQFGTPTSTQESTVTARVLRNGQPADDVALVGFVLERYGSGFALGAPTSTGLAHAGTPVPGLVAGFSATNGAGHTVEGAAVEITTTGDAAFVPADADKGEAQAALERQLVAQGWSQEAANAYLPPLNAPLPAGCTPVGWTGPVDWATALTNDGLPHAVSCAVGPIAPGATVSLSDVLVLGYPAFFDGDGQVEASSVTATLTLSGVAQGTPVTIDVPAVPPPAGDVPT